MLVSKVIRVTGYFLLSIVIFLITIGVLFNFYFNKKIIDSVKEHFSDSTHNEYNLSIDELTINLFTQSITLRNFIITPSKNETSLKTQYAFKTKKLRIVNFSIMSYISKKYLIIDGIEFEDPQLSIFQGSEKLTKNKTDSVKKDLPNHSSFSKKINSISIHHFDIENSKINVYKNEDNVKPIFTSADNAISFQNFCFNLSDDKKETFLVEKLEVSVNNFSYKLKGGLYTIGGKRLYASYTDSLLIIDSLKIIPNFSKSEFAKKAQNQTSRAEIISTKVNCKKINYDLLFNDKRLEIDKVEITDCGIDVFRDNTFPLAHIDRPSLQAMVKNLPFYILVDTIEMKNGTLHFEGITPNAAPIGKISVTNMNIVMTGIQNDTSTYTDNQSIVLVVNGSVLNQGKFTETCTFPLKYTEEFFYCSGSMTSMPMSAFNPVLKHTKHLVIKSGQLDSISFSYIAHKNSSEGTMKFIYHNLEIEMLNLNDHGNTLKQEVETLVANEFIVHNSNPDKDGVVRLSKIHAIHNPYRYFINYSMQSILSGIEPAIIGEKTTKWLKKNNK